MSKLPDDATGLTLCRIDSKDVLHMCEQVQFHQGRAGVDTVLRRAAISGLVEIDPPGELPDYFADIMDRHGDMVGNVALDRKSYAALKNHWMRCKVEKSA